MSVLVYALLCVKCALVVPLFLYPGSVRASGFCPGDISEPSVTKLRTVVRRHKPKCPAKRLVCYVHGQGYNDHLLRVCVLCVSVCVCQC